ncbi:MAG TPA: GTPase HflX, partial [Verrucomicrobiales bacterium]|nr:GTPase HflX [Verrucomicrobiales bacterium]
GKAEEVSAQARELGCDCIVFDNQLAPNQQREWEEAADMTVIDREEIILDIFARRAQTREARLQVELARMEYALPRMARMWGHLDREGGGGSGGSAAARGMGEQQIEVDRRMARKRIDRIKADLSAVRKQRATQRKERQKAEAPHAAIVGYTNAGKSTLLNLLSGSEVLEADMLFATLDPTTRRVELPDGRDLLVTDTVGFVRNLPHRLVESFKATLEEAVLADFLVHVLDASEPELERLCDTTLEVMTELGAAEKPVLTVLNKIDLVDDPQRLRALEAQFPEAVSISAKSGEGMDTLHHKFVDYLSRAVSRRRYRIPQHRGDLVSLLHAEAKVLETSYEGNDVLVVVLVSNELEGRLEGYGEVGPV